MAPSAKYFSFLCLLFLISSLQVHARESEFFSKVTRDTNNNNVAAATKVNEVPKSEEASRTQEEEPSFTPQNHNGFGLYGHGSEQFSPNSVNDAYYTTPTTNFPEKATTTTTTTEQYYTPQNYEQKSFNTGYPTNNYNYNGYDQNKQQGMRDTTSFMDTAYTNNNNNDNNYRYSTRQQGMRDARYMDNSYLNNNNNYYNGNNEVKKQGMSDTRFLENGKYFYDVNNEEAYHHRYHNQYEYPKQTNNGYDASASYRSGVGQSRNSYNNYGGYNANTNYDFSNTMDDQEFRQSQEEYVP